ncbi:MAG: hypothetical protein ABIF88_01600 [archaeon]
MKKNSLISKRRIYNIISSIIILTLLFAITESIYQQRWLVLFTATLALVLTSIPLLFRKKFNIRLPSEIEIIIVLFIYATLFLGEIQGFYETYWWWDILLHAGSAMTFGFIGFTILYLMYAKNSVNANPLLLAIFSLTFAIAIGTTWEIFEFIMDQTFGLNMQKNGLIDTMTDLIVNTFGALIALIIALIYFQKRKSIFLFDETIKKLSKK